MLRHNLQASLITDTDTNREYFRSILTNYLSSLPKSMNTKIMMHNRNQLEMANPARKHRTRMMYLVAGMRSTGTLGKGKAINYLHGTETATWGAGSDLVSLMSTLAENHPHRLYIFESTAFGFGPFRDMYMDAKRALRQKAIFVTWWRSPEIFSVDVDSKIYEVYGGSPAGEERKWMHDVKRLYGYEITKEQIAWWRYTLHEKYHADLSSALQEFPWYEDQAFQMTGSSFFDVRELTEAKKAVSKYPYGSYSYSFDLKFDDMSIAKSPPRTATLRIWDYPKKGAYYILGADPAYGSSDGADQFAIEVFRVYGNIMIQVAEFATHILTTMQFAWVLGHLAGTYRNSFINLEVQGPGEAVLNELHHMQDYTYYDRGNADDLTNIMGSIGHYIYRRQDSLGGGSAWHWKTTGSTKPRMMNDMRSAFAGGQMIVKSDEMLNEMRYISQEGVSIEASKGEHDDLVIGGALACVMWKEQVQMYLLSQQIVWSEESDRREAEDVVDDSFIGGIVDRMVGNSHRKSK